MKKIQNYLLVMMLVVLIGCTIITEKRPVIFEIRPGSQSSGPNLTEMIVMGSEQTVYISENVVLSNQDIVETRVIPGINHPLIEITLTNEGTEKFAIATEDNLNNPLGIIINGRLISAPIVQEKINTRTAIISGSFSEEEAEQIANGMPLGKFF